MDPVAEVRRAVRAGLADLASGALVLAAVSGGADSLALAAALAAVAPALGLRAGAVTVDHGLQAASADRAAAVAATCRRLGLDPVRIARVSVGADGGPEAAARTARYAALEAAADETGAAAVLLGHTLDDQAETVLLGLARGSGARSLAGMPATRGRMTRPLLSLRRQTLRDACAEDGLEPWDDPHNSDPAYTRVRVREQALPALEGALGPGVAEALARSADLLRADADALDALAALALDRPDALAVATLQHHPTAIRTRVIRLAALAAGSRDLTAGHVRAIDRLVTDWHGQGPVRLPTGLEASRVCDRLQFR